MASTWLTLTEIDDYEWECKAYRDRGTEYTIHSAHYQRKLELSRYQLPERENFEAFVRDHNRREDIVAAPLDAGCFYPRIWRPFIEVKDTGYERLVFQR